MPGPGPGPGQWATLHDGQGTRSMASIRRHNTRRVLLQGIPRPSRPRQSSPSSLHTRHKSFVQDWPVVRRVETLTLNLKLSFTPVRRLRSQHLQGHGDRGLDLSTSLQSSLALCVCRYFRPAACFWLFYFPPTSSIYGIHEADSLYHL